MRLRNLKQIESFLNFNCLKRNAFAERYRDWTKYIVHVWLRLIELLLRYHLFNIIIFIRFDGLGMALLWLWYGGGMVEGWGF